MFNRGFGVFRKSSIRSILMFLILFACMQSSVWANTVKSIDLVTHKDGNTTESNYYYLIDETQSLSLNDVLLSEEWQAAIPGINNRGFIATPSWMKFTLNNSSQNKINTILEYVDPAAVSIDLYHRPKGQNTDFTHENFTFNAPIKTRPVSFLRPAFPISTAANTTNEVYIRVSPGNSFPMHSFTSFNIWENNSFYRHTHKELALLAILLLTEIFMALLTIVLFFYTRDSLFLFYSIFAISAASLFASLSGVWSYFIATEHYEIWMVVLQINLCQIAAILFIRRFLETQKHFPLIDKLLLAVLFIDVIGVLLNILGSPYYSRIIIDFTAIGYVFLIPLGIAAHRKGVSHALLFTSSWIIFIVGMVLASMRLRGYIPDSFISEWLIYFGGLVEVILLLTIMVLRLIKLNNEKEIYEHQYRSVLQETASQLKGKVEEQTKELLKAKNKAENEARIDMLTGLTNRRAFTEIANQFLGRAKRTSNSKLYMAIIDIDFFKKVNDTFGHAAGDKVLQSIAKVLQKSIREVDIVSRIGGEEFAVIAESEDQDGILNLFEYIRFGIESNSTSFEHFNISVTISIGVAKYSVNDTLDR